MTAEERPVPESGPPSMLVEGKGQDVVNTLSRRCQPTAWRRAVRWLVAAKLHPRACSTTVRVADDLARRMDYVRGIAVYDLQGTARRLRVGEATVKRHVAVLRELGALAWMVHGSKRNLHLPGRPYTATATIYGAVIPAAYDDAMGHRLSGTGYEARIVGVTDAGRERAIDAARTAADPVDNSSKRVVDNSRTKSPSSGREPHSLACTGIYESVEVSGGYKDTSRARRSTTSPSVSTPQKPQQPKRSAAQAARDVLIARQVRARVQWTQTERLRRLAYVLRPWIDAGRSAEDIVAELQSWYLTWRPMQPGSYIAAQISRPAPAEEPQTNWAMYDHQAWQQPESQKTRRLVEDAFRALDQRCSGTSRPGTDIAEDLAGSSIDITLERPADVPDEEIAELRQMAWNEHLGGRYDLVNGAAGTCLTTARRIYGSLVDFAQAADSPTRTVSYATC